MIKNIYFSVSANLLPKNDPRYQKWLSSLKRRPPPWNKGYKKSTNPSVLKISNTFKKLKLDNFADWRKNMKSQGRFTTDYKQFKKNSELAFLIGLILGDGNIYRFPRTECLNITLGTDKPLLIKYSFNLVRIAFGKTPVIVKNKKYKCVNIRLYFSNISKRLNIPSGARRDLEIKLPQWAWSNKKYLISCIRGLFEAEGSFSVHKPTYTYNLSFSNRNISLLNEVEKAITLLGFHPERRSNAVRLRRKLEAFSFIELISFRKYNTK